MSNILKIGVLLLCGYTIAVADSFAGPYIGIGYGVSSYHDNDYYKSIQDTNVKSYNIETGAYINKYLAVELEYFRSGDFHLTTQSDTPSTFNYSAFTINTVLHYYLYHDTIDFHIKFGAGQSYTNLSTSDGSALLYSGGIGYIIAKRYIVGVNYNLYNFDYHSTTRGNFAMNLQYISMDLKMKF
jgi:hypothetical protein